mmetsp:Transcript_7794/g.17097  ORF Transcript_7794/g.17097 Transcript_7794/m.17097 type:complete len:252 (+) Transcript_7794:102-857(+)
MVSRSSRISLCSVFAAARGGRSARRSLPVLAAAVLALAASASAAFLVSSSRSFAAAPNRQQSSTFQGSRSHSASLIERRASSEGAEEVATIDTGSPLLSALKVGSAGMSLLKPVLSLEAKAQALVYDKEEIQAAIAADAASAPVVIYTYSLSPFCTEAVRLLEESGADYKEIVLAPEWFLMLGEGAAKRAELGEMYGQTSMPHIFIGGKSIGGLMSGSPGLVPLAESGELEARLKEAGALPSEQNIFSFFR